MVREIQRVIKIWRHVTYEYMDRCRGEQDLWVHTSYLHWYGIR